MRSCWSTCSGFVSFGEGMRSGVGVSGCNQLRPVVLPVIGAQLRAGHAPTRHALNPNGKVRGAGLHAVHDVAHVPGSGPAVEREGLTLTRRQGGDEGLEVHAPITPSGVGTRQHRPVIDGWCITRMSDKTFARVEKLVTYIERHKRDLLEEGKVSPNLLAAKTKKTAAYWSDVLRCRTSGKSFGDKAARLVESQLEMPHLYLDGGSEWPFSEVDQARYERLTAVQKGRVQQAMLQVMDEIERSKGSPVVKVYRVEAEPKPRAEVNPRELENVIGGLIELAGAPTDEARSKGRKIARELMAQKAPAVEPSETDRKAGHDLGM